MNVDSNNDTNLDRLLERAISGEQPALGDLLEFHREKLTRIIKFRMDPRMRGRLDADDVIQEGFIEATQRFSAYAAEQKLPFFLWLRFIVIQRLFQLHRKHLGVQSRDAKRDISIYANPHPQTTSAILAAQLLGKHTSPSVAVMRLEMNRRVEEALNTMNEVDREILALRRFERLQNADVAKLLGISVTAASNRYIRALQRLKTAVDSPTDLEQ